MTIPPLFNQTLIMNGWDDLAQKARNIYSQFGEDGLLEAILLRIGVRHNFICDVGAHDGIMFSNSRRLIEMGWRALLIECNPDAATRLKEVTPELCSVEECRIEVAGDNSLESCLDRYHAAPDFDILSLDIDGQEWLIWNSLQAYRPRIVVCEYDPTNQAEHSLPLLNQKGQGGLDAMRRVAIGKGYQVVAITRSNLICVSGTLIK